MALREQARRLVDTIAEVIEHLGDQALPPRDAPAHVNFSIHCECVYDDRVYASLLKFAGDFNALTGKRIAICVSTPRSPLAGTMMAKRGFSEGEFEARVSDLAGSAEIGYHGHFRPLEKDGPWEIPKLEYDEKAVVEQIGKEMQWFRNIGISPKVYVAGWWFLTAGIVRELERSGIAVDSSVRKGKADSFGGRYLDDAEVPEPGRPFILPPSKGLVEIQSIFGPVMAPVFMKRHLWRHLERDTKEDLFFVFPLHDWDIPHYYRFIRANMNEVSKFKTAVDWMDILEMREVYMKMRAVKT
jgi:hypothetical protein